MPLARQPIITAAYDALREHGLAGLSMRRLANDLDVQPGALYYHVASKQDLVAAVGEHIVGGAGRVADGPEDAARQLRALLLDVRDGADVISFVYAYRPAALLPFAHLGDTLIRFVLGFVAVEQNRSELVRAQILEPAPAEDDVFHAAVQAIVRGPACQLR